MPREMPSKRSEKRKGFTDAFLPKAAETPTFESKLKEEHTKFFKNARSRGPGKYTASQTGARALAERRREFRTREVRKEINRLEREARAKKMT